MLEACSSCLGACFCFTPAVVSQQQQLAPRARFPNWLGADVRRGQRRGTARTAGRPLRHHQLLQVGCQQLRWPCWRSVGQHVDSRSASRVAPKPLILVHSGPPPIPLPQPQPDAPPLLYCCSRWNPVAEELYTGSSDCHIVVWAPPGEAAREEAGESGAGGEVSDEDNWSD